MLICPCFLSLFDADVVPCLILLLRRCCLLAVLFLPDPLLFLVFSRGFRRLLRFPYICLVLAWLASADLSVLRWVQFAFPFSLLYAYVSPLFFRFDRVPEVSVTFWESISNRSICGTSLLS